MHEQFLQKALEKAKLGQGMCAPNPSVGAVAVQNNRIIAQAYHQGAGTPHAEQLLIAQIPKNTPNVTLYVTLEPCNHWGKTPPCVEAILSHGITRVVYAFKDPNPIVSSNETPTLLREQGIDVVYYPLPEITHFYRSYQHWIHTGKPWVSVKIAQTFDGKIAGARGARVALSNALTQQFTHQHRLQSDVILTTARTINQDNPLLNVRLPGVTHAKPLAIIDSRLTTQPSATVFKSASVCQIYHDKIVFPDYINSNCSYYGIMASNGLLDLNAVISHLGGLGYHDVWVEAGGALFSALHLAGLVNTTYIYLVPKTLGDESVRAYQHEAVLNHGASDVRWQAMDDNMIVTLEW